MRYRLAACLFLIIAAPPALAQDQIRAVGSGTVYPFVAIAAEQFGLNGTFPTPIIEATGTGGGFKLFCSGAGDDTPDINDASRRIADSEKKLCAKNGVTGIEEIPIGFDGIILAGKKGAPLDLTKKQLFMALARELPDNTGALVKNTSQTWKDVDPMLPARPIEIYGPPPTSGTRDTFVELVMDKACAQFPEFAKAYADENARKKACGLLREDGKYIEAGEDYNIVVQKLSADANALGIMGFGFYDENVHRLQASDIEGVAPDIDTIESGYYGISRRLYVYVKTQHIGRVPGMVEFLRELTGDNAVGPEGYATNKGLVPLADNERKAVQERVMGLGK